MSLMSNSPRHEPRSKPDSHKPFRTARAMVARPTLPPWRSLIFLASPFIHVAVEGETYRSVIGVFFLAFMSFSHGLHWASAARNTAESGMKSLQAIAESLL